MLVATKAAIGAVTAKATTMTPQDDTDFEPTHAASQTAHVLEQLQLYGYRPIADEPDPRPLPEARALTGCVFAVFDALTGALSDTHLEPDLEPLLWSTVNVFHRAAERADRELDDNVVAQQRAQRGYDGSEIATVEIERLEQEGRTLVERRDAFELLRDEAATQFSAAVGDIWRPRSGSMVNHRHMTSAMVSSRDFVAAQRQAKTAVHVPTGPKIAFSGGVDYEDHTAIWDALDRVHDKHPDMILLHGGSKRGAEWIARKWAETRTVTHIPFEPDWTRHAKGAPFKRNDAMLETLPIGVMIFPGSGIQDNLATKAKKLGLKVWRPGT